MRVNYRNLPEQIKRAKTRPKPRTKSTVPGAMPPPDTIGSLGPAASGLADAMMTAQTKGAMIQAPAAGKPFSPVAPVNPILTPPKEGAGTTGTALRGSTGFRQRTK